MIRNFSLQPVVSEILFFLLEEYKLDKSILIYWLVS